MFHGDFMMLPFWVVKPVPFPCPNPYMAVGMGGNGLVSGRWVGVREIGWSCGKYKYSDPYVPKYNLLS